MKNLYGSALRCNGKSFAAHHLLYGVIDKPTFFISVLIFSAFLFTGCKKQAVDETARDLSATNAKTVEGEVLNFYSGLSPQTSWELQQARAATSKYRNFDNAVKDEYVDINVIVPEMGYHYLRLANVDNTFDFRKPEILVYNKEEDGSLQLVAVEYAIPIELSPNVAPAGFTGTGDVWDKNAGFGLWLLHAWVWSFNPSGVFNPTNPLVHVH